MKSLRAYHSFVFCWKVPPDHGYSEESCERIGIRRSVAVRDDVLRVASWEMKHMIEEKLSAISD